MNPDEPLSADGMLTTQRPEDTPATSTTGSKKGSSPSSATKQQDHHHQGGAAAAAGAGVVDGVVTPTSAPALPPYAGLVNPSCICYLNSLIQCLYHTPAFRAAVYRINTATDEIVEIPKALQSLFYSLSSAREEAQSTKVLTDSFGWGPRELSIQHDIQELLTKLRDTLESRSRGHINVLFSGFGEKYFRALDGSYESKNQENFYDIHLQVNNQADINTSFDAAVATEQLLGENGYLIEEGGTKRRVDAETGYRYRRFPPIVFLHLKRFEMDLTSPTLETKKINSVFQFPRSFDMSSREQNPIFVTEEHIAAVQGNPNLKEALQIALEQQRMFPEVYGPNATNASADYELYAVLIHSGGVHHGHYTCTIRDFDAERGQLADRWFNYDDHIVTEQDEEHAVNRNYGGFTWVRGQQYLTTKNAYMLAYVRKSLVPKLFFKEDNAAQLLSDKVKREFDQRIDEEQKQQRVEAAKNRQCHISLVTEEHLFNNVHRRQTELLESEHGTPQEFQITVPKQNTMEQLYQAAAKVLERPTSEFKLHWFVPTGAYDSKFRVGDNIPLSTAAADTIENKAPRAVQLPDRPWLFKLFVEFKKAQPTHTVTNAARFAQFAVSSFPEGLNTMSETPPAMPLVDNRMFNFLQSDLNARVEILLDKRHGIEAIAFQCPVPKNHQPGANFACTRYDVRIQICDGDQIVYTAVEEHRRHAEHVAFHCDHLLKLDRSGNPVIKGDRVILERINVTVFDHYNPTGRFDVARLADNWVISRLKVQVPPTELPQPLNEKPRFISEDMRSYYLPVKFYSWRTCKIDFCGYISIPISEFIETSFPVLRHLCHLTDNTRLRIYEEGGTDAELIETHRKHLVVKKRDDLVETILIVQEEPPANSAFIYEFPFVPPYLRSLATQRSIMLFNFRAPEHGAQAVITVPDFATHDMVAEEVGRTCNMPWDRIRLYGCKEQFSQGGVTMALPKPEPFRSDEESSRSMLGGRREGILFYEILRTSLKEAESVMQITCHYHDARGMRVSTEPFRQEVSVGISMPDLAETMMEFFGFPFETPHVYLDIQSNMIENFSIVLPPSRSGVVAGTVAGATSTGGSGANTKSVEKFFRSFENKMFELRIFPEADSMTQLYCVVHGEYHQHSFPQVVTKASAPPPSFFPIPVTADVTEAKNIIARAFGMSEDDFQHEPKHHEIMLFIHNPLHFPTWDTKLKDYFLHNPSQLTRPKVLLVNHRHEKEKPGSRYVPQAQPSLNLHKREQDAKKKEDAAAAGAGGGAAPKTDDKE